MISRDHSSNLHLFTLAVERGLTAIEQSAGIWLVSSYQSKPNGWHRVYVSEKGYSCSCKATGACSHGSYAYCKQYPLAWLDWFYTKHFPQWTQQEVQAA